MTRDQHLEPRISAWGVELVRVTEAVARAVCPHIGRGDKHTVDAAGTELAVAVDPIEGTDAVAAWRASGLSVIAVSDRGGLMSASRT